MPSCSSRDRRARSFSCESTTCRARRFSLASALRCSLMLSTSAHTRDHGERRASAIASIHVIVRSMLRGRLRVDVRERRLDIVQIDAGADHPAPALQRHDVAELRRELARRRTPPHVAHIAAAARRRGDQLLDGQRAVADRASATGRGRRDRAGADASATCRACVDEKIAVLAEVQPLQRVERLLLARVLLRRGVAGGRRRSTARSRSAPARRNAAARFPCSTCTRPASSRAAIAASVVACWRTPYSMPPIATRERHDRQQEDLRFEIHVELHDGKRRCLRNST